MVEYKSLSELTYNKLKDMILSRDINPGERIIEDKIAEMLGVSRTTAKRAINNLLNDGILLEIPRQGVYVRKYSVKELIEVYEIRAELEYLAAKHAAINSTEEDINQLQSIFNGVEIDESHENPEYVKADIKFHKKILSVSNYQVLPAILDNFRLIIACFTQKILRPPVITFKEHQCILEAISRRDQDECGRLMREHILKSREVLIEKGEELLF